MNYSQLYPCFYFQKQKYCFLEWTMDGNIKKSAPVIGNNIQKPDVMKMKIMKRGRKKDPRWRIVIVLQNTD